MGGLAKCALGAADPHSRFRAPAKKLLMGRLIDKLDATGRTDAVAHAARRGIIHL